MKLLLIDLNHPAHYLNFGVFSISVGNLIMVSLVVVLFIAALFLPFPTHSDEKESKK